jgi:heme-degrading monooxygenase HmoA
MSHPNESSPGPMPAPPYYAVVFSSCRTREDAAGYAAAAERMSKLAREMPGYLGMESVRGSDGMGITVSYWTDEDAIRAWQRHAEHLPVQRLGRERWYEWFELRVCKVERSHAFERRRR